MNEPPNHEPPIYEPPVPETSIQRQPIAPPPPPPAPAVEGRGIDFSKLGWGVALVAAGLLLLLDRFDLLSLSGYWRYWPLILVVAGLVTLTGARTAEKRRSALWLLGIGAWLLVNTLELAGFWWSDSWPLVIMLAGVVDLLQPKPGESRADGLWPLALGGWLLITIRHWWGFTWGSSWPVLLIAVGALLVVRALREGGLGWRPQRGNGGES